MPREDRLDLIHAQLVVVDLQQRLLPYIRDSAEIIGQTVRMIRAAREMQVPVTISEQYPEGLGPTDPAIIDAAGDEAVRLQKTSFSLCGDNDAREHIISRMRPAVIIAGIETHVCVQQTALDLRRMQMRPVVLADAVGARRRIDHEMALGRVSQAGAAVTTVEATIYQLLEKAGTDLFRRVLRIVKDVASQARDGSTARIRAQRA